MKKLLILLAGVSLTMPMSSISAAVPTVQARGHGVPVHSQTGWCYVIINGVLYTYPC